MIKRFNQAVGINGSKTAQQNCFGISKSNFENILH